jgi:syntaxin-binding protein 5
MNRAVSTALMSGQKVLVVITTKGTALFYSVPFLELITRLELYYGHEP